MKDTFERLRAIVRRGIFYTAYSDERGALVNTNLWHTICPRCKVEVEPNVEHLCGNRLPQRAHAVKPQPAKDSRGKRQPKKKLGKGQ